MKSKMTLPKLLAEKASSQKDEVALRHKYLGIWNEITWEEYYTKVEQLAIALSKQLNFEKEEKLVVIGENRPQWLISQMATQVLGGISVGVYQESLPEQIDYYLNDTKARIVVAEDQEQVDKLLEIEEQIPLIEYIIYYDKQGMRHYDHPKLVFFEDLLTIGEALLKDNVDFFHKQTGQSVGSDIAIIAYSAATTGDPKGAMLTHTNLISAAENLIEIDNMKQKDDYLSFLPLAWIHEQVMSITIPLLTGKVINFPERASTVLSDLREIGPHTLLAPPRVFQTLMSNITTRIKGATKFKKFIYKSFKKYGDKVALAKLEGKSISAWDKFMYKFGDWLVFSAIRDHFGLARVKRVYIAGAALNRETYSFFHSIGVNLKQTYGGTELTGIAFVHRDNDIAVNSSGKPLPETEVKIAEDGEIFVKNPAIFARYLNKKDRMEVKDGWLTLGDCGYICDKGHLNILDRKEDIIKAPNGEFVYPSVVENKLKVSPYIQEAIIFGQERPYLTAILNIDFTNVGRWADSKNLAYTAYEDLAKREEVIALIEEEVAKLMDELPKSSRVRRYVILHKQFNANDGELTRTLKVRRRFIREKYQSLIEDMYAGAKESTVTIDKGSEDKYKTSLQVIELIVNEKEVA